MNKLVEEIIKPILEANSNIKKVVGVYGGRFQPFGPHHYKTYKWLKGQVDDAYITTSNIKKPPRHPMNFKEKVRHMSKMGVPSNRIIEEKSPYNAKNLAKKYDKDTTAFVYVFGAKDAGRLGGSGKYFQDYKKNKRNLKGFEENGYYLTAPHVSISVGGKEVSGTTMRELLGSDKFDDKERKKLFKDMFGYFNQGVYNMMTNKFKKLFETDDVMIFKPTKIKKIMKPHWNDNKGKELLQDEVTQTQLNQVEKYLDKLWGKVGIDVEFTRHFMDRANDKRNEKPITSAEVMRIFKQTYKKYGKQIPKLGRGAEALMKDMKTDVNVPFVLKWDGKEFDLIAKTIMRKKNFKSSNKKFAVENWLKTGSKKDKALKLKITKLYSKAFNHMPNSPAQLKIRKEIEKLRNQLSEGVDLPIEIGDTVLMGKFKNKKVVIKDIDFNDKGDLMINGRPALKFRILDKIKEASDTSGVGGLQSVDSGPSLMMKNSKHYEGRGKQGAEKLGFQVINYLLKKEIPNSDELLDGWPGGPHNSVSYLPAGIGTGKTPNNQENLTGVKGYNKWLRNIKSVAQEVGMQLMKFRDDEKDIKKQISKDTIDTIKQQKMEESIFSKEWWKKELLNEGGAYGHMAHPFDDKDLTFGDLKKIIELGLGGQLNREDNVTEKLDGQNIMVSWKDGKLIAARNKGHIKNGGKTALDVKGIKLKFAGRGDIANAFNFAMTDLSKAIKSLSEKQRTKIFNNGYNFMNLEVMWPKSANVINYDIAELVFHGALKYDDNAKVIGEVPGSGRILAGMIQQRNQNIQKKYKIGKPVFLDVPKHQDFGKMKGKFLNKLDVLKAEFMLKDSDTLALYHQKYWDWFIRKEVRDNYKYAIPDKVVEGLVRRWAFFEKKYSVAMMKKDIKDEKFLEWVLKFDKQNHTKQVKENMKPFETLFFEVGAEILKNVKGFIAANPDKAVQGIKKKLDDAIKDVKVGKDLKKLNRLKVQLDRLNAIGGLDSIVPSEGIVFKYKGNTYKFTGAFAPINQITGLMTF